MKVNLFGYALLFTAKKTDASLDSGKSSSAPSVALCGLMHGTPMTDAEIKQVLQTGQHEKVKAEFARKLERQLNEERAKQRMAVEDGCVCGRA
jgi:hypothetical protein